MKVLVIDDMLYVRKLLSELFAALDSSLECFAADCDRQAIEIVTVHRPDLITLDLTMPGLGGEGLILRLLEVSPTSRICICSAIFSDKVQQDLKDRGAWDFLVKPIKLFDLKRLLERVAAESSAEGV